jgi:hypothetical protein
LTFFSLIIKLIEEMNMKAKKKKDQQEELEGGELFKVVFDFN